jgi:cyclin H
MPPNDTNGTTNGVEAPKPASLIESTSQYRHWRFSQRQLRDIRHASNVAAVERVKANVKEEQVRWLRTLAVGKLRSIRVTCQEQSAHDEEERPDQAVEYLNWDDERLLVRFYAQRLQEFCRVLKFSDTVRVSFLCILARRSDC